MFKFLRKYHFLTVFIYLFLLLIPPFYKVFFQKHYLIPQITNVYQFLNDPLMLFYPWRKFAFETIASGYLPLWNPYVFCGVPFLANPQTAVFYPLNILFLFLSSETAYTIICLLQLLLAGYFTYLYLIKIKLSKFCAVLGAQTFMLGGYFIVWLEIITFPASVMWIPLIYYAIEVLASKKKFIFIIPLSLIFSLVIFAGHSQLLFYILIVSTIYTLLRILFLNYKNSLQLFFYHLTALLLATTISFLNLLPTFEFSSRIFRGNEIYNLISGLTFNSLLNFIVPNINGHIDTESTFYVGILIMIFFIFSFKLRNKRISLLHLVILIFCLLFSLKTFIYKFAFFYIPLTSRFRMPQRIIGVMIFSLIVIAVSNLNYLLKAKEFILKKVMFILITVNALILIFIYYFYKNLPANFITFFLFLFLYSFLIIVFLKNKISAANFKILLLVISFFDLLFFIRGVNIDTAPKKNIFPKTESLKFLKNNLKLYRVARFNSTKYVLSNALMPYHIYDFQGCDSFIEISFAYFSFIIANQSYLAMNFVLGPENLQKLKLPIVNFLGIKYIISASSIEDKNYELEYFNKDEAYIYRNKNVLPRSYLVNNYKFLDFKKTFIYLSANKYNPYKEVVLNDSPNFKLQPTPLPQNFKNKVEIVNYKNNKVEINYSAKFNSLLILSDLYYPGWNAYIDGKQTKIYRTNICFRSIYAPPGKHKVIFKFQPAIFYNSAIVSCLVLIIMVVALVNFCFKDKLSRSIIL